MASRGRKRARKGQNSEEPPSTKQKEHVEEFATLLEMPITLGGLSGATALDHGLNTLGGLSGATALGHGRLEVEGMMEGGGETGEKEGTLKWVEASNGEVPEDAVEGGWCQSSKEKIYIARAKGYGAAGGLFPGGLKKSSQYLTYCAYGGNYQQQAAVYEVLVNPGNRAALQWVTSRGTVPPNAVEGGFSAPGKTLYIGRQSTTKKDIVPGYIDPADSMVHLIGTRYKPHTFKTFEVLVISGDVEIVEEINRCTLSDISYDIHQGDVTEDRVSMTTVTLENRSSLEQTLTATAFLEYSKSYNWNIGKKTSYTVSISMSISSRNFMYTCTFYGE